MTLVPRNQRAGDEIWGDKRAGLVGGVEPTLERVNPLGMGTCILGMRSRRQQEAIYVGGEKG